MSLAFTKIGQRIFIIFENNSRYNPHVNELGTELLFTSMYLEINYLDKNFHNHSFFYDIISSVNTKAGINLIRSIKELCILKIQIHMLQKLEFSTFNPHFSDSQTSILYLQKRLCISR